MIFERLKICYYAFKEQSGAEVHAVLDTVRKRNKDKPAALDAVRKYNNEYQ